MIRTKISVEKLKSTATQDHVVNEGQFVVPELEDNTRWGHIQSSLNKHKSKVGNKVFNSVEDAQKYCLEDIDWTHKEITLRNLTHEDISESFCIWDPRKDTSKSQSD
ncbi:hypothetical protein HF1_08450 [Mycoplasma haemofelis str. Langford 1]|uniref:Uncharacterized protein n=2 Tax=Mycoplasma haemofelis TaxID=29501 RepID=F6FIY4_MYCHI|nr:hypothetical protein [Mycoplasma haemofelis]AEG73182.1 hypothetical protein MHF_0925 [Mycoplasma haemofelis Ohio2]CBY92853.1 hypothetical protein HF1_08450 [Mycoplasma haemofelis str. Langford 1]